MASRSDTELLTEHFGYPPVSLLDEIINSVNFLAERALHSIEQGLLNAPPASLGFRPRQKRYHRAAASRSRNGTGANGGGDGEEGNDDGDDEEEDDPARRHREEIEAGTHQLETLLWASIDKNFDRFEIYVMRNILCLRAGEMEWMRLGHYEGLDFDRLLDGAGSSLGDPAEMAAGPRQGVGGEMAVEDGQKRTDAVMGLVEGVNRLRRKLQASQRLQCMLVAERARNAALLGEMRRLQQQHQQAPGQGEERGGEKAPQTTPPLRFLHDQGDLTTGDAETPLTTTTAFTLSQLQALRELSAALRGAMPGLASPLGEGEATAAAASDDDADGRDGQKQNKKKKSWRQERLEYVETATRKHLENVRGLELGRDGEVRDGEWDGGGRGLARGEVESLERVVSLLGGSRDEQDRMDES
ncbi:uncharacterized protein THITE_42297 [Thermothielavioides terrestris NRRL 8126]|uniref:Kinetochore-associated protein MTW1 n=1 Tax=Thermothielavioides terrestris (strain ATCC 38088 / NRRL 8126) TaxID=578455 RepID=G2R965_THETT|nr:uncharacterized protein THITE_42297 [Thermothielavioides terrestris NRRL 8126]AEO69463.1 hypothetical protein THITE_42297 [Thermothielavioides terrestris NRRL 8126]